MAKFIKQDVFRDASSSGLVVGSSTSDLEKVSLNRKSLKRILRLLYKAKVNSLGLYKAVTMVKFAPQTKHFPGSLASLGVQKAVTSQGDFFQIENPLDEVSKRVPPRVVPPGTELHRRWLWFATLTDRREVSDTVYFSHCKIFEEHPEFYGEEVTGLDLGAFVKAFANGKYKIGSPSQSVSYWLVCARTLFGEFDGDPVKLLTHAGWSVGSVYAWKHEQKKLRGYDPIPGWGKKLISLYFLYLSELGYRLPEDAFPADVHAQAILLQTGTVKFGKQSGVSSSVLAEMLRKSITEICKEERYDVVEMAHASWLLGSQLCNGCSSRQEASLLCPVYSDCKGRLDTSPYFARGHWPKDGNVMTKGGYRPKFGLPTQVPPRLVSRKKTQAIIPIMPLFL